MYVQDGREAVYVQPSGGWDIHDSPGPVRLIQTLRRGMRIEIVGHTDPGRLTPIISLEVCPHTEDRRPADPSPALGRAAALRRVRVRLGRGRRDRPFCRTEFALLQPDSRLTAAGRIRREAVAGHPGAPGCAFGGRSLIFERPAPRHRRPCCECEPPVHGRPPGGPARGATSLSRPAPPSTHTQYQLRPSGACLRSGPQGPVHRRRSRAQSQSSRHRDVECAGAGRLHRRWYARSGAADGPEDGCQAGAVIEALGFPFPDGFVPELRNAVFRVVGNQPVPVARPFEAGALLRTPELQGELVRVRGELREWRQRRSGFTAAVQAPDGTVFEASSPGRPESPVKPGSTIGILAQSASHRRAGPIRRRLPDHDAVALRPHRSRQSPVAERPCRGLGCGSDGLGRAFVSRMDRIA